MGLEIEGLSAQVQATERQLALLGEELEAQLSLSAKGLADRAQLSALQQQEAALLGKIAQLRAKRAEAHTQLHELEIDRLRQITADHKAAITALRDLRAAAALWTICLNPSVAILRKRCGNINFCFSHRMFAPIAVVKQFKGVTI